MAAWGGTFLQHGFGERARKRTERRDDLAVLRVKVEELFLEIDRLDNQAAKANVQYLMDIQKGVSRESPEDQISIGKIRSYVSLYFQDCTDCIAGFDERAAKNLAMLRDNLQNKEFGTQSAIVLSIAQGTQNFGILSRDIRVRLAAIATSTGASIRGAAQG